MSGSRAHTIQCDNCKATINLIDLRTEVACKFCGHNQVLDAEVFAKLERYQDEVDLNLAQAQSEREVAETWKRSAEQVQGSSKVLNTVVALLFVGGPLTLIMVGGLSLMHFGVIAQQSMTYMGPVATVASFLGLGAYYGWYFMRNRKKGSVISSQSTSVTCPQCGAVNMMQIGQVLESCSHCQAALMPGQEVREQAVAVAVDEHRKARMERFRAERSGMAVYSKIGMSSTTMAIFVGGSFLLMLGGGAVAFSISMATGQEPYSPAIFILWAAVIGLIGGVAGFVTYRKRRKQRLADELSKLVTRHSGELLGGVEGTASWLNRYWAGPFDIAQLTRGPYNDSAHLMIEGYPILVDLDLVAASPHHRTRGLMLLACELPGMGDPTEATLQISPDIRGLMKQIAMLGFDVDFHQAGLFARADEPTIRALLKKNDTIGSLSQVGLLMAQLACAYGGSPVPPIP